MKMRVKSRGKVKGRNASAAVHEPLQTKRDLAQFLRVGSRCVDNWMARGLLPYLKIGRSVRFRPSEIQSFLENCRVVKGE